MKTTCVFMNTSYIHMHLCVEIPMYHEYIQQLLHVFQIIIGNERYKNQ